MPAVSTSARRHVGTSVSLGLSATLPAYFTYFFTYFDLLSRLTLPCSKPTSALPWSCQTSAPAGHQRSSSLRTHSILTLTLAHPFSHFSHFPLALRVHHGPQTPPRQRQRRRGAKQCYPDFRRAIRKCAHPILFLPGSRFPCHHHPPPSPLSMP